MVVTKGLKHKNTHTPAGIWWQWRCSAEMPQRKRVPGDWMDGWDDMFATGAPTTSLRGEDAVRMRFAV